MSSMTSDRKYILGQKADGTLACDCPAWKFAKAPKPPCKHILKLLATEPVDNNVQHPTARQFLAARNAARGVRQPTAPAIAQAPVVEAPIVYLRQTRRCITLED